MSDHEFEKQVHQKLEELKLRPSDTVWMEVEKNIRNNKRRRGLPWWWMAALVVGLSAGAYTLYHYTAHSNNTTDVAKTAPASLSNSKPAEASTNSTQTTTTTGNTVPDKTTTTGQNTKAPTLSQTSNQQPPVEAPVVAAETNPSITTATNKQPVTAKVEKKTVQHTTINKIKKPVQQPLTYNSITTSSDEGINTSKLTHEKPRLLRQFDLLSEDRP